MNKRDKEFAKQAWWDGHVDLTKFAELVRADEREANAEICEEFDELHPEAAFHRCASAIRARGNT
jgi:hypothetical protein